MAKSTPFTDEVPFELRIKYLADEELLDVWVETQELEGILREEWGAELELAPEYEKIIINELRVRAGKKYVARESINKINTMPKSL